MVDHAPAAVLHRRPASNRRRRRGGAGDRPRAPAASQMTEKAHSNVAGLPFAASFDALAFIIKTIRDYPPDEALDLVPALGFVFNSTAWDATGIREVIPYQHFMIGWYRPEQITDFQQVEIWGRKTYVHPTTLERLDGKRLVLRTDKHRQVLIAVK
jgi:hypothetical protein